MAAITAIDIARESYLQMIKEAEDCEEGIGGDTVIHVFADTEQLDEYQAKLAERGARTHSAGHGGGMKGDDSYTDEAPGVYHLCNCGDFSNAASPICVTVVTFVP